MRFGLVLAVAVMACGGKSKPRQTSPDNDQCFYGCEGKGSGELAMGSAAPTQTPTATPTPQGKLTPSGEKAFALRQAADLLEKAGQALDSGNKNLADNLFNKKDYFLPGHFSNNVFPGQPINVTATLRLKWY